MNEQQRTAMKMALNLFEAIVNADWRKWEERASPEEFERWVKSRTYHTAVALREALASPPPQRKWTSLPEERVLQLFQNFTSATGGTWLALWRETEKELQEKNT